MQAQSQKELIPINYRKNEKEFRNYKKETEKISTPSKYYERKLNSQARSQ
jgi:hypothetical protein